MKPEIALFVSTFTTLLAIINPLEALPVFLALTGNRSETERRHIAGKACFYATLLILFFLFFGAFLLQIFGVSLPMVRIAGGIVLMRIGFELFAPSAAGGSAFANADRNSNIAFMPLAIPLMCGPGAIATILGMMATIKQSHEIVRSFSAIVAAIALTMLVTNLCLAYAGSVIARIGPTGIDAVTRIVGFFVSAMGVSLIFDGIIEALKAHGMTVLH